MSAATKMEFQVPVYLNRQLYRQLAKLAEVTNRKKTQVLRDGLTSMVMEAEAAGLMKPTRRRT